MIGLFVFDRWMIVCVFDASFAKRTRIESDFLGSKEKNVNRYWKKKRFKNLFENEKGRRSIGDGRDCIKRYQRLKPVKFLKFISNRIYVVRIHRPSTPS